MYKIIGADGLEYGPVPAEQIQQWILQGRANGQTKAQAAGTTEWKSLAEFSEFFPALRPGVFQPATPPMVSAVEADALANEIIQRDYYLDIGGCFSRGWELVKANFWLTVGACAIVLLLSSAIASVPFVGAPASLALNYVLWGGLYWFFLKLVRGQRAEVGDAFAGFTIAFAQLLLFSLVGQVLMGLGLLLCLLPGIYLAVCWMYFSTLLIMDKGLEFWPAMELSRKVVTRHWWAFFGFAILGALLCLLGLLACVVGLFVAVPVVSAATVYAYQDIFCSASSGRAPDRGGPLAPVPGPMPAPEAATIPTSPVTPAQPLEPAPTPSPSPAAPDRPSDSTPPPESPGPTTTPTSQP